MVYLLAISHWGKIYLSYQFCGFKKALPEIPPVLHGGGEHFRDNPSIVAHLAGGH
jgi:hypothetical protein